MPRWKILPLQQAMLSCEAEKASLISDCSKEGDLLNTGICEIYCLRKSMWLILSFIWDTLQEPGAGLFLKPNILSLLPVPGWSCLSLTEGRRGYLFIQSCRTRSLFPCCPVDLLPDSKADNVVD